MVEGWVFFDFGSQRLDKGWLCEELISIDLNNKPPLFLGGVENIFIASPETHYQVNLEKQSKYFPEIIENIFVLCASYIGDHKFQPSN